MNNTRRPYLMSQSTGDYKRILFAASRWVCGASLFIKMGFFTSAASRRQRHHLGNGTLIFYIGSGRGVSLQAKLGGILRNQSIAPPPTALFERWLWNQEPRLLTQRPVLKHTESLCQLKLFILCHCCRGFFCQDCLCAAQSLPPARRLWFKACDKTKVWCHNMYVLMPHTQSGRGYASWLFFFFFNC